QKPGKTNEAISAKDQPGHENVRRPPPSPCTEPRQRLTPLSSASARAGIEELDVGSRRSIQSRHLGIRRLDDKVLIGRVRAPAVTESELAGGQPEGSTGEGDAGPRPGQSRPEHRIRA